MDVFSVYRFGEGPVAPSSALPIGADRKVDETKPVKVPVGPALLNSVLGLSNATDEESIMNTNVVGFAYV